MKIRIIVVAMLLLVLVPPPASATSAFCGSYVEPANQDTPLSCPTINAGVNHFNIILTAFRDLNSDGDYSQAGEVVTLTDSNELTNCGGSLGAFSCSLSVTQGNINFVTWANGTNQAPLHVSGNFSIQIQEVSAVGAILGTSTAAIRLTDPAALVSDVTSARDRVITAVNGAAGNLTATIRNNMTDNLAVTSWDDVDTHWAVKDALDGSGLATQLFFTLDRLTDGATNGVYTVTNVFSATTSNTDCHGGNKPDFACSINYAAESYNFTWRNVSLDSQHVAGNYTFRWTWLDTGGLPLKDGTLGISMLPGFTRRAESFANSQLLERNLTRAGAEAHSVVFSYPLQNTPFVVHSMMPPSSIGGMPTQAEISLKELQDSGGVKPTVVTIFDTVTSTGDCTGIAPLECVFNFIPSTSAGSAAADFVGYWKASDSSHHIGNFSFNLTWEDNLGNPLTSDTWEVRIAPDYLNESRAVSVAQNGENNATVRLQSLFNNMTFNEWTSELNLTGNMSNQAQSETVVDGLGNDTLLEADFGSAKGAILSPPSTWTLSLTQDKDLNNDGDFADPGEQTILVQHTFNANQQSCASDVVTAAHFSCIVNLNNLATHVTNAFIDWRVSDASHVAGNYTITFLTSAVGPPSGVQPQTKTWAVHLIPTFGSGSVTTTNIQGMPVVVSNGLVLFLYVALVIMWAWLMNRRTTSERIAGIIVAFLISILGFTMLDYLTIVPGQLTGGLLMLLLGVVLLTLSFVKFMYGPADPEHFGEGEPD